MLRALLACVLSLVLAAASLTVAEARARAALSQQIVICTGYGVTTITLDSEGRPSGPLHPCPDCLSGLGLCTLPASPEPAGVPLLRGDILPVAPAVPLVAADSPVPRARDPPASVA
ncbi:hypothetical protein [Rhodobacter sp. NSM]|uniref:hypothetical protein n=1 Tax=Rhodobacter sp. NSM TaxID=3457501 RepID=UPI003FD1B447